MGVMPYKVLNTVILTVLSPGTLGDSGIALPQRRETEYRSGLDIPKVGNIVDPGNLSVVSAVAIDLVAKPWDCIPGLDGHYMGHVR